MLPSDRTTEEPCARPIVLLTEDEPELRLLLRKVLEASGYRVISVQDGLALLNQLETAEEDVAIVLSDIRMPELDGLHALERLRERNATVPVVLLSAFVDDAVLAKAYRLGATMVLQKPFDMAALQCVITNITPPAIAPRKQ